MAVTHDSGCVLWEVLQQEPPKPPEDEPHKKLAKCSSDSTGAGFGARSWQGPFNLILVARMQSVWHRTLG